MMLRSVSKRNTRQTGTRVTQPLHPEIARIDGQPIHLATLDQAVAAAIAEARAGRGFRLFTLNLDHIVKRREDARFRAAYRRAEFVSADGAPVALLARRQNPAIRRTTGADLVLPLACEAARAGIPVALFGSDEATLVRAAGVLRRAAPGLTIAHHEAPRLGFDPVGTEAEAALERIARSGARLVLVALGAPKQELFAAEFAERFPGLGFVCIGAALDFLAGTQIRAPEHFRRLGLEWLWRLGTNPVRLARRYAKCALVLAALLLAPVGRGARSAEA
jgi:exopolysaccharide biosynthesis WecB/TagA/CpsF family protein